MPLANLPLELKLNIAECLDPISCFDFSIACWHHWAFCEPIVQKHAHLYAENRCIDANFAGTLLWTKLKKILQDPRLGWYVRELNLPANRRVYWDPDTAHDWQLTPQSQRLPEQELHIFHSAAEDLRPIYAVSRSEVDVVECIERDLAGGSDEAVIAILVHHLPLLKILRITDLNIGNCFKLMVENVALNYDNPANASVLPFKRLESVSMAHWDSEYACSPDWALKFGSIPSVQNFVGLAMGSDGSGGFWDGPEGRLSNIKELFLVRCQFSIPSLENVFKSIKTLEKFSYEAGGSLVSYSSYEAKRVIEALAICQGHSLEHLYLDDADDMHEDFGEGPKSISLQDFKKLKTLRCSWDMIFPIDNENSSGSIDEPLEAGFHTEEELPTKSNFDVKAILPESLESLHLVGPFKDESGERIFKTLTDRDGALPNLRYLYIHEEDDTVESGYMIETGAEPDFAIRDIYKNPLGRLIEGHGYQ